MHVLIPAYCPDDRLLTLVDDLLRVRPAVGVLVVDDGSGPDHAPLFAQLRERGVVVLTDAVNRGKGHALKRGFARLATMVTDPDEVVVCADSDGQHSVVDVLRVGETTARTATAVLGTRTFGSDVPLRSRFGNSATKIALTLATRRRWRDTQTGLRGYPAHLLGWLQTVDGERYEYETNLLLAAARQDLPLTEVDVATIYLDENASSHFRPIVDSLRIYTPLLLFAVVSFGSFLLDAALLLTLEAATGALLFSVVTARVVSSIANFAGNRYLVFRPVLREGLRPAAGAAWRYWALVASLLAANYAVIRALTGLGLALVTAKVVTEVTLFASGYLVQRHAVFAAGPGRPVTARLTGGAQQAHARLSPGAARVDQTDRPEGIL